MGGSDRDEEAIGLITDLLSAGVGFDAAWGFSRWITGISNELLTSSGDIDWRTSDGRVAEALADVVALPPDSPQDLPAGVRSFGPELYVQVAASQRYSAWAPAPGQAPDAQRLVLLRCHIGKRRVILTKKNAVLMQYRVWIRPAGGQPEQIMDPRRAWPLLNDLSTEIERQLT